MGNKIFIICSFYSIQVWAAIKLHIGYISKAGGIPVLIMKKGSINFRDKELENYEIWEYSNCFSLFMHLLMSKDIHQVWCPDFMVVIKMFIPCFFSRKQICFWVQGIVPEEDYMKFHKKCRFYILNILEYLALLFSSKYILVSYSMLRFLRKKYRLKKINEDRSIIIPCLSEFSRNCNIMKKPNSFVYIGGLSVWQQFDRTLLIFKEILKHEKKAFLHIITFDVEMANKKVDDVFTNKDNISVYTISNRTEIPNVLSQFEYGFIIRECNPVNYVASPIKFAEYLACGIKPVTTRAMPHYVELINKFNCGVIVDYDNWENIKIPHENNFSSAVKAYEDYFALDRIIGLYRKILL